MRQFIGVGLVVLGVAVSAARAEEPEAARKAAKNRVPEQKLRLDAALPFEPLTGQKLKPYVPYDRMPQLRITPYGVEYGTAEELRQRGEKRQAEEKKLREGAERIRQMEQQFAERKREKANTALIGLGIFAVGFILRLLIGGRR